VKAMEENIFKSISYAAVTFFLIAAISLFFMLYENCGYTLTIVNKAITDKGAVYQAENTCDDKTVYGAEIIGSIKNGLKTDIFIDSVCVFANTDANSFNYSLIDILSLYTVEYIFSPAGETECIKYSKVNMSPIS
jgi:hypothetical protein